MRIQVISLVKGQVTCAETSAIDTQGGPYQIVLYNIFLQINIPCKSSPSEQNRKCMLGCLCLTITCWATTMDRVTAAAGINTVLEQWLSSGLYNSSALLFLKIKATVTCLSFKRPAAALHTLYMLPSSPHHHWSTSPPVGSPAIRPLTLLQGHKHWLTIRSPWIWTTEYPPPPPHYTCFQGEWHGLWWNELQLAN